MGHATPSEARGILLPHAMELLRLYALESRAKKDEAAFHTCLYPSNTVAFHERREGAGYERLFGGGWNGFELNSECVSTVEKSETLN